MPKKTDRSFQQLPLFKEVQAEVWNAQNGVMITYGVGHIARAAYTLVSTTSRADGTFTRILGNEGSSRELHRSMRESVGLNVSALAVIDALNNWDDRSREQQTSASRAFPRAKTKSAWYVKLQFNRPPERGRSFIAAPFEIPSSVIDMPYLGTLILEGLDIDVEQIGYNNPKTMTTLRFTGSETITIGIEPDGLVVPGAAAVHSVGESGIDQQFAVATLGSFMRHTADVIIGQTLA